MGKSLNRYVMDLLTNDEKVSLSLSIVHSKSSWSAGEIMKKAHYKYLEIQKRASYFLKRFTEYYLVTDNVLLPVEANLDQRFEEYLRYVIGRRSTLRQYLDKTAFPEMKKTKTRNEVIASEIKRLERFEQMKVVELYNMIKDFDRWNSFRILPPEHQEPSAYKRRHKHRYKKRILLVYNMDDKRIQVIRRLYENTTEKAKYPQIVYVPMLNAEGKSDDYCIIKVNKRFITNITTIGLYAFDKRVIAEQFIKELFNYIRKPKKHCTDGQIFWPRFRDYIQVAINRDEIANIRPSRKLIAHDFDTNNFDDGQDD